jgi:GT2 family glycosyltransferase
VKVSVVVTTYDGQGWLPECLEALRAQTRAPDEVVVVDDASPADDGAFVRARYGNGTFPGLRVKRLPRNVGHAGAAAAGFAECGGEVIALVNNDAAPEPDWLARALEPFADPCVGSVATRLVRRGDPEVIDSAGDSYTAVGHAYKRLEGTRDPRAAREGEVFSACAAAALYRRAAYEAAGGFRPELVAYYDDVDLGLRLRLAGYVCRYQPEARCPHRVSASYGAGTFRQLALTSRNQAFVWWSGLPLPLLLRTLPEHALFSCLQLASRLVQGGLGPLLWGKMQALLSLPLLLRLRREAQARRRVPPSVLAAALDRRWLQPGIDDLRRRLRGPA